MATSKELRIENLRALVKEFKTADAVARLADTAPMYLSQILNGAKSSTGTPRGIGDALARKLESGCGKEVGWMDRPHDEERPFTLEEAQRLLPGAVPVHLVPGDEHLPGQYRIPMVTLRLQAGVTGFQGEPDRRDGGTMGLAMNWVDRKGYNPEHLMAIKVRGDSMEPTFYEDDTVVINLADKTPVDNGVFAVNYDGEAVVKRLSRDAGQWWLMSDNADQRKYYRRMCGGKECIIIGRIVRREGDQF